MSEAFTLEERIMSVWQTKEDIDILSRRIMDGKEKMTEDEIVNYLIGLSEIHETRCQEIFEFYENNLPSLLECL